VHVLENYSNFWQYVCLQLLDSLLHKHPKRNFHCRYVRTERPDQHLRMVYNEECRSQWPSGLRVKAHIQRSGAASNLWFNSWKQIDRFVSTNWITSCWPLRPAPLYVCFYPKAWVCSRSPAGIAGSKSRRGHGCLSGRGLCDELITRPEESYRLCRVLVCNLETSRMSRLKPASGF
jgi:hypothetical protein